MYHWLSSMASFRFCDTYLLHIKPFVVNKSAISPFLGGLLLRCLRKICGISAKEPYDDTQPPRPFSSIDVTVLKRRETSPTCVGFFCRKELYLCDVLVPTRALFVWGSFPEKTPTCMGFFCRKDSYLCGVLLPMWLFWRRADLSANTSMREPYYDAVSPQIFAISPQKSPMMTPDHRGRIPDSVWKKRRYRFEEGVGIWANTRRGSYEETQELKSAY